MDLVAITLAGTGIGILTGLLPSLHVNTLAAIAAGFAVGPEAALFLVAVGTVHTIVNILPATYLGIPGDDTALATLPAHQFVKDGRGPDAIAISVASSLAALLAAVALLMPFKWLLGEPIRLAAWLDVATPWLIAAVILLLWWQQPRWTTLGIMALAGGLGVLALQWPHTGPAGLPTSPLLPLLTGLFALPTLLATQDGAIAWQRPRGHLRVPRVWRGVTVSAFTAVMPGLTAAVATSIAQPTQTDARRTLATLSAVNTAHLVFTLAVLWALQRTRSGLAQAIEPWFGGAWQGVPLDMWNLLVVVVAAGTLGAAGTLALEPVARRSMQKVRARIMARLALVLIVSVVVWLNGIWGLALLFVAALIGQIPLRVGTRRVHLAAVLLVPIFLASL